MQEELEKPLDLGLTFAVSRRLRLFYLSLIPAIVELVASFFHYSFALQRQHVFLVIVFAVAADAWLLLAVTYQALTFLRRDRLTFSELSLAALSNLPKTFFSYIGLVAVLFLSAVVYPLLVLVVFLIWAPAFCAGESFVAPKEEEEEEEDTDLDDEERFFLRREKQEEAARRGPSYFTNKSFLELGFGRSLQFSLKNLSVTAYTMLLIWLANILPVALVGLLPSAWGFPVTAFRIIAASWTHTMAAAAAAFAFLLLLPKEGKAELQLPREAPELKAPSVLRVQGRRAVVTVLLAAALASTYLVFQRARLEQQWPVQARAAVESTAREGELLKVTVRVTDEEEKFRWLDPNEIRVAPVPGGETTPTKPLHERAIAPAEISAYGDDDKLIEEENFVPRSGPLKLILRYKGEELARTNKFILCYIPYAGGDAQQLAEFEVP